MHEGVIARDHGTAPGPVMADSWSPVRRENHAQLVDPPDDMSLGNPPSNKPLLDYLARGFIEHGFDMKWIHREITNSRTYQLSWKPNDTNLTDHRNFSRATARRLPAEAIYDAVRQATASSQQLADVYEGLERRAIAIAGTAAPVAVARIHAMPSPSSDVQRARAIVIATAPRNQACCRPSISRMTRTSTTRLLRRDG